MSRQLLQLVRSQILFREVNERLRDAVGSYDGPLEFLCECSRNDCIDTVALDLSEYERIRSHSNLFLISSGHERLEVDRVVDQGQGYVLVEKIFGADEVIAANPRSRGG